MSEVKFDIDYWSMEARKSFHPMFRDMISRGWAFERAMDLLKMQFEQDKTVIEGLKLQLESARADRSKIDTANIDLNWKIQELKASLEACRDLKSFHVEDKDEVTKERDQLKAELAEAEKVIEFYASEDTWIDKEIVNGSLFAWGKRHPSHDVSIIPYSIGESNGNFHCLGKKAREYLAKKSNSSEIPNSSKEGKK